MVLGPQFISIKRDKICQNNPTILVDQGNDGENTSRGERGTGRNPPPQISTRPKRDKDANTVREPLGKNGSIASSDGEFELKNTLDANITREYHSKDGQSDQGSI